jgi:hypothetical protein
VTATNADCSCGEGDELNAYRGFVLAMTGRVVGLDEIAKGKGKERSRCGAWENL